MHINLITHIANYIEVEHYTIRLTYIEIFPSNGSIIIHKKYSQVQIS